MPDKGYIPTFSSWRFGATYDDVSMMLSPRDASHEPGRFGADMRVMLVKVGAPHILLIKGRLTHIDGIKGQCVDIWQGCIHGVIFSLID